MMAQRGFTYLPNIDAKRICEMFRGGDWGMLQEELKAAGYERVGFDRLLTIILDMQATFGRWGGFDVLDVGCNTGLFSYGMAAFGNRVVGIDSSVIDTQQRYDELSPGVVRDGAADDPAGAGVVLRRADIREFLRHDDRCWDIILLLSVAHHWETGYAHSGLDVFPPEEISWVIGRLTQSVRYAIYYECPLDEPGFEPSYGRKFLDRFAGRKLAVSRVGLTVGPNGYTRELLRLEA
jgi:SAM-dependent methyltransferase